MSEDRVVHERGDNQDVPLSPETIADARKKWEQLQSLAEHNTVVRSLVDQLRADVIRKYHHGERP